MGNPRPAMRDTHQRKGASSLPWLLAGIGVLVCLTAFTLVILHADPAESPGVSGMPYANAANLSCLPPLGGSPGVPAITPHLNLAANAASVANGGIATFPTFTADDARAWVTAHVLPGYEKTGTMTIRSVTFLPQAQACQWPNLGLDVGLAAGTPLCVVVLEGSITVPSLQSGTASNPPATYSYAILGFNGVTGNRMDTSLTNSLPAALAGPATPTAGSAPTIPTTPGTDTPTP
jgi:hypothetical protein